MLNDFPKLWNMTYDEKTVTARHSLQAIWKVGLAGPRQKEWIIQFFTERFAACESEKHPTMIRGDLLEGLRKLYDAKEDERLCETAHKLIESIEDMKKRGFKFVGPVTTYSFLQAIGMIDDHLCSCPFHTANRKFAD